MRIHSAASLLSLVLVACVSATAAAPGGNGDVSPGGTAPAELGTLPCDVDAVLAKNCQSCHSSPPKFGAPMALVTRADLFGTATTGKPFYQEVGSRIHDDARPMPQPPNARLSPSDMAVVDKWVAAGAPAGDAACSTTPPTDNSVQPLSCVPDQKIRPATAFPMTDDHDLYVCYGFETEAAAKRHIIAGAPVIDNPNIVHHVLLYQAAEAVSPTPTPCGAGGGQNWRLVTGWAPGGKNFELPPEAGFAEEQGPTHWAVQVHYNNVKGLVGQLDSTGYDLCTTDKLRPNDADILATGTVSIKIPPRSTTTTTCDFVFPDGYQPLNVISSWAHMHKLGRAQSAYRLRGGVETALLEAPNYDFYTGAGANAVNVDLTPSDHVKTTCMWKNTSDQTVKFGENTDDEMCFAFLTYYPKITDKSFVSWALPAALGSCTTSSVGN